MIYDINMMYNIHIYSYVLFFTTWKKYQKKINIKNENCMSGIFFFFHISFLRPSMNLSDEVEKLS